VDLDRIAAMLSRLGRRGYTVREEPAEYGESGFDPDSDPDEINPQVASADAPTLRG